MPTARSLDQIKLNLLQPALTSHFEVTIFPPPGVTEKYLQENTVAFNREKLQLLCSETVLPGSTIATFELNNDYHGSTIRHAHRRLYDDRIELTFYVSANDYLPIRFFETWIKYIAGESIVGSKDPEGSRPGSQASNYFYRMNYPDSYIAKGPNNEGGMSITKFERTGSGDSYNGGKLQYQFINTFPIAINSMPVSYDASSLLKCTVSMSYIRYVVLPSSASGDGHLDSNNSSSSTASSVASALTPAQIAKANQLAFDPSAYQKDLGLDYGKYATTGGVSFPASQASGNTITSAAFNPATSLF